MFVAIVLLGAVFLPQRAGAWQANANQLYSYWAPGPPGVGPGNLYCAVDTWHGLVFGIPVAQVSSYDDNLYTKCLGSHATVVYLVNGQLLNGPRADAVNGGTYKVTASSIAPTWGALVGASWGACSHLTGYPCVYWSTSPWG